MRDFSKLPTRPPNDTVGVDLHARFGWCLAYLLVIVLAGGIVYLLVGWPVRVLGEMQAARLLIGETPASSDDGVSIPLGGGFAVQIEDRPVRCSVQYDGWWNVSGLMCVHTSQRACLRTCDANGACTTTDICTTVRQLPAKESRP